MAILGVDTDIAAASDPGELLNPPGASTGADVQSDSALGSGSDQPVLGIYRIPAMIKNGPAQKSWSVFAGFFTDILL